MSANNQKILEAALDVFMRYGTKKTTMNDVAKKAGVARQTLYNAFPGKSELLRAVILQNNERVMADIAAAWQGVDTVPEKLECFFTLGPLAWYDLIKSTPEAIELFEGVHEAAIEVLTQSKDQWKDMFIEMLAPFHAQLAQKGVSTDALADFIFSTSINAKNGAASRQELRGRLDLLNQSVTSLLA